MDNYANCSKQLIIYLILIFCGAKIGKSHYLSLNLSRRPDAMNASATALHPFSFGCPPYAGVAGLAGEPRTAANRQSLLR